MPAYLLTGGQGRTSRPPLKKTATAVMVDTKASTQAMSGPKPGIDRNVGTAKLRMINRQSSAFQTPYARNTILGAFQTARLKVGTRDSMRHNPYTLFGRGRSRAIARAGDRIAYGAVPLSEIPSGEMGNIPDDRPLDVDMKSGQSSWVVSRVIDNGRATLGEIRVMRDALARTGSATLTAVEAVVPHMISAAQRLSSLSYSDPTIRRGVLSTAAFLLRNTVPPQLLIPAVTFAEAMFNDPTREQLDAGLHMPRPRLALEYNEEL